MKKGQFVMQSIIMAGCVLLALAASGAELSTGRIIVACVGDSITEMKGRNGGKSYPELMQGILGDGYQVINFGKSGCCVLKKGDTPYSLNPIYQDFLKSTPHIVIIGLGTNDSRQNNWKYKKDFSDDYRDLIKVSRNLTSKPKVIIALPLPMLSYPGSWQ